MRQCRLIIMTAIVSVCQCYSACSAGVLISIQPYMPSGLNPVYASPDAQNAVSLGLNANSGSAFSLASSPYSAVEIYRTSVTGEVILNFTITAQQGWSATISALRFDVGSASVPLPDAPVILVSSNPGTNLYGGPYGVPNSTSSVGQLDISFTPFTVQAGSSLQISAQFGTRPFSAPSAVNYQIPVGKSLLLNAVSFFGSVTPTAAVPEPNSVLLYCVALSSVILHFGRKVFARGQSRRIPAATTK